MSSGDTTFSQFRPMLLAAEQKPFVRKGWLFEPKSDGMRAVAIVESGKCRIYSRNGLEYSQHFPRLARTLSTYKNVVLDGEIVAFGQDGQADFERLLTRINNPRGAAQADLSNPVQFFVFDILSHNLQDVMQQTLEERKRLLDLLLTECDEIKKVFFTAEDGVAMFEACARLGFEGIVAKQLSSLYRPGIRCQQWKKIKQRLPDDVIVCGYKKDEGMIIGQHDQFGQLKYAGIVRFGFKASDHQFLKDTAVLVEQCPLVDRRPAGRCFWFAPLITAEVYSHGRTGTGILRNPVLSRWRPDQS